MFTQVARGIDRVRGALPHLYQLAQVLSHVPVLSCMLVLAEQSLSRWAWMRYIIGEHYGATAVVLQDTCRCCQYVLWQILAPVLRRAALQSARA